MPKVKKALDNFLEKRGKVGGAFGSYGWSGESLKIMNEKLTVSGFSLVNDGFQVAWNPDESTLKECIAFGKQFSDSLID